MVLRAGQARSKLARNGLWHVLGARIGAGHNGCREWTAEYPNKTFIHLGFGRENGYICELVFMYLSTI
jgi:hypothetical protein